MALWLGVQWGNTYVPSLRIFAKSMSNTIHLAYTVASEKSPWTRFAWKAEQMYWGCHCLQQLPQCPQPPCTASRAGSSFCFNSHLVLKAQLAVAWEKRRTPWFQQGLVRNEERRGIKGSSSNVVLRGKGSGARRMDVIKGKSGVHPKAPFLHLSVVRMTGGLQN